MLTELDIVIVSYNTRTLTLAAIQSIYEETRTTPFNLIVVDNNSQDGSADAIEKNFPQLTLIRSSHNCGFASAVNLAAAQFQSDYYLLLNPDTVILDGAIDKLFNFVKQRPENGIWGGVTLNKDHSINTYNAWSRPSTLSMFFCAFGFNEIFSSSCLFNRANYGCWQRDTEYKVDMLQGCFFLTERSVWEKLGGFDETFFMYGEESDYCLRAIDLGYQPIVTPEARIIHYGGASEKNPTDKAIKLLKAKVELVNRHSSSLEKPLHRLFLLIYVFNKAVSSFFSTGFHREKKIDREDWRYILINSRSWLKGWR